MCIILCLLLTIFNFFMHFVCLCDEGGWLARLMVCIGKCARREIIFKSVRSRTLRPKNRKLARSWLTRKVYQMLAPRDARINLPASK